MNLNGLLARAETFLHVFEPLVWPAMKDGRLQDPHPSHVLDALTREAVGGRSIAVDAELLKHPEAGTVGLVDQLPPCHFCLLPARYEAPARQLDGAWRYLCVPHYISHATHRLGIDDGQHLVVRSELADTITSALELAVVYWREWAAAERAMRPRLCRRRFKP